MSVTKTARIMERPLAIEDMPTMEALWSIVKRQQVRLWLTSVYALTLTVVMVLPTAERVIRFFGL